MRVIHLARKPLSESSVASNVLEHGTGALHINGCRISTPGETVKNHSRSSDSAKSKGIYGDSSGQETHQTAGQKLGRWPNNVILQHRDGCRCTGTQKVKSNGAHPAHRGGLGYQGGASGTEGVRRGFGEDGKETIAAWNCAPGCPVAGLDVQTGDRPFTWTNSLNPQPSTALPPSKFRSKQAKAMPQGPLYRDSGGASRFYKQVGGSDE